MDLAKASSTPRAPEAEAQATLRYRRISQAEPQASRRHCRVVDAQASEQAGWQAETQAAAGKGAQHDATTGTSAAGPLAQCRTCLLATLWLHGRGGPGKRRRRVRRSTPWDGRGLGGRWTQQGLRHYLHESRGNWQASRGKTEENINAGGERFRKYARRPCCVLSVGAAPRPPWCRQGLPL